MEHVFNFYDNKEDSAPRFTGKLKQEKCAAYTCERMICIGLPYCREHLRKRLAVRIHDSSIDGAGKGVFARIRGEGNGLVFKQGEKIMSYYGELIDGGTLNTRYGENTAPYTVGLRQKGWYEDGALKRGIGALVNHSKENANVSLEVLHGDELSADESDSDSGDDENYEPGKGVNAKCNKRKKRKKKKRKRKRRRKHADKPPMEGIMASIHALRDIYNDEELLMDYGFTYEFKDGSKHETVATLKD